jgi:hypothetical protein
MNGKYLQKNPKNAGAYSTIHVVLRPKLVANKRIIIIIIK